MVQINIANKTLYLIIGIITTILIGSIVYAQTGTNQVDKALGYHSIQQIAKGPLDPTTKLPQDFTSVDTNNDGIIDLAENAVQAENATALTYENGVSKGIYAYDLQRYHLRVTPAKVGVVQPIDHTIFKKLCADEDGCTVTIAMRNWDSNRPGLVASMLPIKLFYDNGWWRTSHSSLVEGKDGDGITAYYQGWDCYLVDAETYAGSPNQVSDTGPGFGFQNAFGGTENDATTICELILED